MCDTKTKLENLIGPGHLMWFEYHCNESHESDDAPVWYRSHQQCVVLKLAECDGVHVASQQERFEIGQQLAYRVRFADGLEWDVFEDELMDAPDWQRPEPPSALTAH